MPRSPATLAMWTIAPWRRRSSGAAAREAHRRRQVDRQDLLPQRIRHVDHRSVATKPGHPGGVDEKVKAAIVSRRSARRRPPARPASVTFSRT